MSGAATEAGTELWLGGAVHVQGVWQALLGSGWADRVAGDSFLCQSALE